jgi:signal transduction histidine kinase
MTRADHFRGFGRRVASPFRQLSVFRQSSNVGRMPAGFDLLSTSERLRVGQRFLRLRPGIAAAGAACNALLLGASSAAPDQKLALALALGSTVASFAVEAWWLGRHALSERWLGISLSATLLALALAALLSGGLNSPFVPLFFAPVVVGYAAFARRAPSFWLFGGAVACLSFLGLGGPLADFPVLPAGTLRGMLFVSSVMSLVLLAVGVTSLVDAHGRVARSLDRFRGDMLQEAERRALSVEHLGAQVAHEVKNPLAAARGLVQLVQRHTQEERDVQRLQVVVTEIDRALSVLQDYLSFARPLSDLTLAKVELGGLLADVTLVLEARAQEKSVKLRVSGEPLSIWADRQRLRDALLNLALNAITACQRGGQLQLSAAPAANGARLVVSDDGLGMSAEQLGRLGRPFASGAEGGTGLGVLLADSVARQHGGTLRFESAPGGGTRAILELPLDSKARSV